MDFYEFKQPSRVNKLMDAIELVSGGVCNRADVTKDIKVYKVKDVVRVDIKLEGMENDG